MEIDHPKIRVSVPVNQSTKWRASFSTQLNDDSNACSFFFYYATTCVCLMGQRKEDDDETMMTRNEHTYVTRV